MQDRHLAHFNVGRLALEPDDPRLADFLAGRAMVRRIAENARGFVWKIEAGVGSEDGATAPNDPKLLLSLSLWETAEALYNFVWKTLHKRFVVRRAEWFAPTRGANFVAWWVQRGHRPTIDEAFGKLKAFERDGESDAAFGWDRLAPDGARQAALT